MTVPEPVEMLVQKALSDCGGDTRLALYVVAATAYAASRAASAGMVRLPAED